MPKTISMRGLPASVERVAHAPQDCQYADEYDTWWKVTDYRGREWHMGRGHPQGKSQIVVWYPNGRMWTSYANNMFNALEGAINDAWFYI